MQTELVLVSVLMPSYNHERYLSEAIECILNQTVKDLELIIVDDCSRDDSRKIIDHYRSKDHRVNAFFHEHNMGISTTMNELISKASGTYISSMASDDLWDKSKLEKQLLILQKNEKLIVWSEGKIINEESAPTGQTFTERLLTSKKKKSSWIFEELISGNYIFGSSVIYHRESVKGIWYCEDLKYLNDHQFLVDLAENHQFYYIQEPLAMYRIHATNTISSNFEIWKKDKVAINQYFLQKYGNKLSGKAKGHLYFNLARWYYSMGLKKVACLFFAKALKHHWAIYEFRATVLNLKERIRYARTFI